MRERVWNFCAGPATLPLEVLEEAREALLRFGDSGAGILEVSHRGRHYAQVHAEAQAALRRLLGADDGWALLFVQGGASLQFHMVPLNLGLEGDYVLTGVWSEKALEEARKLGPARVAASSEASRFDRIPAALDLRDGAPYVHVTTNNTVWGTQWAELPRTRAPLVCDASSDILSRPLDLSRCDLVYAGAQKNLGPAGVALVLVRRELLERSRGRHLPAMLDYAVYAEHDSLHNTPPTFAIYVVGLVARWLEARGGVAEIAAANEEKARVLYDLIDATPFYRGLAQPGSRSRMNVTFRCPTAELDERFAREAEAAGLIGLKGHRTAGGLRASLYNAMPRAGAEALASFMAEFARTRG